jgi:hypothetical protein
MDPISVAFGLAQFAPQIIKWITGSEKAAEAAGQVVAIAETVTGRTGAESVDALKADPAMVLQFRQAVMANEAEMDKAYLADRADARKRDVAYIQAGRTNGRANFMVAMDAIGLVVCLVVLALYADELRGEAIALISTVASIFGLCLRDAHQFEFGSSRGAQETTELLARAPAIK